MDVLITGGSGIVGTAITDHLSTADRYHFTSLDIEPHPDPAVTSIDGSAATGETVRDALESQDALVHLAHGPIDRGGPFDRSIGFYDDHA